MWRRDRRRPATSVYPETDGRKRPFKEAAMKLPLPACPSTTVLPSLHGDLAPISKARGPFHLSTQLQDTFFQEELGKSSSEEGSSARIPSLFSSSSHPCWQTGYLALSAQWSSCRKLYSLASPCRLLPSRTSAMPDFKTLKGAYLQGELNVTPSDQCKPVSLDANRR